MSLVTITSASVKRSAHECRGVDTSVWSLALRRKTEHLNPTETRVIVELSELIREGRARLIGLVRQELLSGIKTTEHYEKLRLRLRSFPDEPIDTLDHEEAAKAGNRCRGKGIVVSIVDVLLCAVAIKREWAIFTTDPDFTSYAKVLPISIHGPRK
jgi:predicted nucleic acid-binding protein